MSSQFQPQRRVRHVLVPLLLACIHCAAKAYTYEPPGRDPISIDKIRNSEKAVILTSENFDELTSRRIVFIKFHSPYCPHCKGIAGAWNELATYYKNLPENENILIGSVDCTDSPTGKGLCARFKIVGLPTLLYGDASFGGIYLEEYGGEKTFVDLKLFASEALVPTCNPGNLDACSSDARPLMETFIAMSYGDLDLLIKKTEILEEDAKTSYRNDFAKLQKSYDQLLTAKELQITRARENANLAREIIAIKVP